MVDFVEVGSIVVSFIDDWTIVVGSVVVVFVLEVSIVVGWVDIPNDAVDVSVVNCVVVSVVLLSVVSSKRFVGVTVEARGEVGGSVEDSILVVVSLTAFVLETSVANLVPVVLPKATSFSIDAVVAVVEEIVVVSPSEL